MGSEKISIIIPVYNTEKYVEKAVRSVMGQTYQNLEIICVNDGSTDGSAEILYMLQKEDPRIIIVEKENGGLGDARNCGLARATSEWIGFLDSDDTIQPDTYEKISKAFQSDPDIIIFGVRVVREDGRAVSSANDEKYYTVHFSGEIQVSDYVIKHTDVSVANKLFRKSVLEKLDIHFEKIYYEDFPFTLQYFFSVRKAYYFKDKLYNYLRHSGSIMAETFNSTPRAIDHLRAADYLYSFLEKHANPASHGQLLSRLFTNCYWFSIRHIVLDKRQEAIDLASKIYEKYPFLQDYLVRKNRNGTIIYERQLKHHFLSAFLQKLFSINKEHINYEPYKVVRLFSMVIYKRQIDD